MAIINEREEFTLTRPKNSWDMNYHLLDFVEEKDYLIDISDVYGDEDIEQMEEDGGITFSELARLEDIDYIKEFAWKIIELEDMDYIRGFVGKMA